MNAFTYLRVSTVDQARRNNEPEGYSIPAQRRACERKAEELDATVIKEYADRGASARSADRPALQRLLKDIRQGHVDYVIIHKVDRLARNLYDDVMICLAIRQAGAQLVSVVESIDESPAGRMLHGIMAVYSEFYANNLSAEALKGAIEKAARGGTPYRVPIGYRNVIEREDGRERRIVLLDSERAPYIHWAFERYATGDYSLRTLAEALNQRGFRGRRTGRAPIRPIGISGLHKILTNRYYLGYVTYRGLESKGQHPALVTPATFNAVQAIIASHRLSDTRITQHNHYLKGTMSCANCGNSLSYTIARHRFEYFYCLTGKRTGSCSQPYLPVPLLEAEITQLYNGLGLNSAQRAELLSRIRTELDEEVQEAQAERERQQNRRQRALAEQQRLLQAFYAYAITEDVLKIEQARVEKEVEQADTLIRTMTDQLEIATVRREKALQLAGEFDLRQAYLRAHPLIRRYLNQAMFTRVLIGEHATSRVRDGFGLRHDIRVKEVQRNNKPDMAKLSQSVLALVDKLAK